MNGFRVSKFQFDALPIDDDFADNTPLCFALTDKGIGFAFMVHALANSKGDKDRAVARLDKDGHSGMSAALSGASDSAGGVTIPQAQAAEVIELLRPRVTVINSGARIIDMPAGEVRNARQATSATANYGAENHVTEESEPTFDKVDQSFKTLRTLVPVGNALLRHSGAAVMQLVRDDMLDVMGLRKDLAFLRGDGTADTPKGLGGWVLAGHTQTAVAKTAAAVEAALRQMVSKVQDANVAMISCGWIMRASTRNFLASLREPNHGSYLFPSIDQSNTLLGYPVKTTSQLPDNLGVGGDETEVFFADFNDCMVGDSMKLVISSSTEAAYVDTSGDTVSASPMSARRGAIPFEVDGTSFRMRFSVNAMLAYEETFSENFVDALRAMEGRDVPDFTRLRRIFWAGVGPDQHTLEDAGELISDVGFAQAVDLITQAAQAAFPEAASGQGSAPGNAPAGGKPRPKAKPAT
ncbi:MULTISPECIES: phage major capsid protein [Roseobacteraceae]|uniref:Phage capsid family protein n=1 Tax=Pseudosulfitobacter pseudonitzschiae TaxID=1402135 RepID=A0A221K0I0_9RHOB|nr:MULTISPECIES: phage major capsid protein [Roseobacteraceae]ASM72506.1 phage capsid family protein [Pseudosulfitobacter pseudonitzschiae]